MSDNMARGKGTPKAHKTRKKKRSVLSAVLTVLLALLLHRTLHGFHLAVQLLL